jgi:hypothetical protein
MFGFMKDPYPDVLIKIGQMQDMFPIASNVFFYLPFFIAENPRGYSDLLIPLTEISWSVETEKSFDNSKGCFFKRETDEIPQCILPQESDIAPAALTHRSEKQILE